MADTDTVIHDESGSRFLLKRGDDELGGAYYETRADGGIVFTHTEIDQELQERGLGSALVKGALDQLRTSTSVRIGATCPFVRKFLAEHPEYNDLTER
jgi:predicted GNAT family acetyltransferase